MITLYDSLCEIEEGLLDVDLGDKLEQNMLEEFIKKTFSGKYKITKNQLGGFKATGTMILKNFKESEIPAGFYIIHLKGNMYIEDCPNLTSIGNLFGELRYDDTSLGRVEGILSIANCKNFNTLKGIPSSVDNLILTDLPKLKSIEYLPKWAESVMITKCGKKWTKEQIAAKSEFAKITCSEEKHENFIMEAMSEPILLRAYKYLIDNKIGFSSLRQMIDCNIEIDKIRPSQVTRYRMPADKIACKKAINLMQRDKNSKGFAIGFDDDKLVFLANSNRFIYTIGYSVWTINKREFTGIQYKPIEFLSTIFDRTYGEMTNVTDIYIYDVSETQNAWKTRMSRSEAKQGMITTADYARIARENRERYKKALAQLKAIKASDEYVRFAKQVEERITAYSKFIMKIIQNPNNHDTTFFSILTDCINSMTREFANFVRYFKRNVLGTADSYDRATINSAMNKCKQYFDSIDQYLNKI